ncbi:MAG: PadR family transcriptional regulator [Bacteroidia bacterium]|jgi:PadR family transcriptional regulator PadR
MDIENSKAQLKKGILEFCILSIISRGEAYTSDILEEMKAAKLLVVEGTMYPLLSRLKNEGLLSYNWVESKSGPPRKYYQLTDEGKKFMEELHLTWVDLVESVERLTIKTKDLENK